MEESKQTEKEEKKGKENGGVECTLTVLPSTQSLLGLAREQTNKKSNKKHCFNPSRFEVIN